MQHHLHVHSCAVCPVLATKLCKSRTVMQVCLDTASFEVVTNCWQTLLGLLKEGLVDLLLCNEDEALAVAEVASPT